MQIKDGKIFREMVAIRADLRFYFSNNSITQKQIQQHSGVNQGQISRILSGANRRVSKSVLELCQYANINPYKTAEYELSGDMDLIDALRLAVGNDPAKAKTVTRVIRALVE